MENRIKQLRTDRGMSLQDLSDKTGINKSTLASYETRGISPKYEKLATLANFFEVPKVYLLGNDLPEEDSDSPEIVESFTLNDFLEDNVDESQNKFFNKTELDSLTAQKRFKLKFDEVHKYFTESDFNNLSDILTAYSLLTVEDRKFFSEIMKLKSELLDTNFDNNEKKQK
ncbi:helix-turn-helix domain-containing protein [Lactococcus lactis]|uniref:helix-turn-helix domain-containing protein n=1 Tax=Lactococcus lactis TaxID=1358 RepID=UPI003D0F64D9